METSENLSETIAALLGVLLKILLFWFVWPVAIILGVMHDRWEWCDLQRAMVGFLKAMGLTASILALIVAVGLLFWNLSRKKEGGAKIEHKSGEKV